MTLKELTAKTSMKAIGRSIGLDIQMADGHLQCDPLDPDDSRYSTDLVLPSMKMVEACRANDFDFFQPFIDAGKLTVGQMHRAAERYHLGKTRSGQPIFWMIDDMLNPQDAHIAPDTWISDILKRRDPMLEYWCFQRCLFGLHLLRSDARCQKPDAQPLASSFRRFTSPVAIVRSECSAVVLSELFPESVWMAYVSIAHLDIDFLAPLVDHKVIVFPDADGTGDSFRLWSAVCQEAQKRYPFKYPIRISPLLELHASEEQKKRKTDIVDFLFGDSG